MLQVECFSAANEFIVVFGAVVEQLNIGLVAES